MNNELEILADRLQQFVDAFRESRDWAEKQELQAEMRKLAPAALAEMEEVFDIMNERHGYPLGLGVAWDGINGWMH